MFEIDLRKKKEPLTPSERWTIVIAALIFFTLILLDILSSYSTVKLGALFIFLFWFPLIAVHEIGHALAALFVKWHVRIIVIGAGKIVKTITIGNIPIEIRALPFGGYVSTQSPDHEVPYARLKNAFIYFGGPGIELLVFVIIGFILGWGNFFTITPEIPKIIAQSLAFAALFGAVTNLIPSLYLSENGPQPNDGLGIIWSLFRWDWEG